MITITKNKLRPVRSQFCFSNRVQVWDRIHYRIRDQIVNRQRDRVWVLVGDQIRDQIYDNHNQK
jgi:hypothetical protein